MSKINFAGIITKEKINEYEKNNINCEKVIISSDKDNIQIKAIPIMVILIIFCNVTLFIKIFNTSLRINPLYIIIGVLIGGLLLLVHEFLHAIVYPKNAVVTIGFIKPITFVALGSYPMSKKRFILMCLLPFALGIIPLIIFILTNNNIVCSIMFGMMCIGIISPYPDIYNVLKIIKIPKGKEILFEEEKLVYLNK